MNKLMLILAIGVLTTSCVSSRKYSDMEVLKEYFKQKGDTLALVQKENIQLKNRLSSTTSELALTTERLESTQTAMTSLEAKYQEMNLSYAQLQAANQQLDATSKTQNTALQGQLQLAKSQNESMKSILDNLDRAYQLHLNGAILTDDTWNQKLSRMQEVSEVLESERSQIAGLYDLLLGSAIFSDQSIQVASSGNGVIITMFTDATFRTGKTQLNTKGRGFVKELTGIILRNSNLDIQIEGHTDDQSSDNSNWNVSVLRASAVAKEMIKNDLRPSRILATGRSSHRAISFEKTEKGRKLNRRVEIKIVPRTYQG